MDWNPAAQIRHGKSRLSIPAVGGANELEQGFVLRDGQQLTLAEHPARWGEVARKYPDLAYVWLCHMPVSSVRTWEDALQRDAEAQSQERLPVLVRLTSSCIRHSGRRQRHQICCRAVRIV
jgi:hypothetical protein